MRSSIAVLLLLVVTACGVATRQPPAPETTTPVPALPGWVLVTERDRAVTVHVGEKIEVALTARPGMSTWGGLNVDEPSVLRAVPTGITAPRGFTIAGFEAVAPGTANIRATATPLCSPGQACPQFAMLFEVTVTVI